MMETSNWPETVIFWGAGATQALDFPSTARQGDLLIAFSKIKSREDYYAELSEFEFFNGQFLNDLADLLYILDDDNNEDEYHNAITSVTQSQRDKAKKLFSINDSNKLENLIVNLRLNYDFSALKNITKLCAKDRNTIVMNVFNLIDYHMSNNEGFYAKGNERIFIDKRRLLGARNALVMIIVTCMTGGYFNAIETKQNIIAKYKSFADKLAEYMQIEAYEKCDFKTNDRKFYLFSYAIISLNWDHFLNWMIFHAHKDYNDNPAYDTFDGRHIRLKFFNDFSVLMGLRELNKANEDKALETKIWYPYNESVVQRINDPDYNYDKIVRIGKYYYPHGCLAWRACPNCGSVTGTFGDIWDRDSSSLFPPSLFPTSRRIEKRSDNEKSWFKDGWIDAIECSYCGSKTEIKDTPLLMQTAVKSNNPPILRLIQAEINACLENARHIIFMGYSLPDDDLVWRSILLARKGKVNVSVVVGTGGSKDWQKGCNANDIKGGDEQTIKRFFDLFESENLRFCTCGIPDVFDTITVQELLKFT